MFVIFMSTLYNDLKSKMQIMTKYELILSISYVIFNDLLQECLMY